MSTTNLRDSMKWVLMVAFILGGGAIAQAQNERAAPNELQPPQGMITSDEGQVAIEDQTIAQPMRPERPKYWIGILGGPVSDELRAQIDVPAGKGILVRDAAPESPAAEAGLKVFDVLLLANDAELADVADLTELVRSEGENGGTITLDVLRRGQHEMITLTPEARPEQAAGVEPDVLPGQRWGSGGTTRVGSPAIPFFDHSGQPLKFRMFGPDAAFSRHGFSLSQMPNGVSVSIQKQNDEPAHITVKRGNDTWDIVGDDPNSLVQLPDDVRPFVEQLLAGGGQMTLPTMPVLPGAPRMPAGFDDDAMQQRLQQMEQNLQELQQQMQGQFGQPQQGRSAQPQVIIPAEPDTDHSDSDASSTK